MSVETRLNFVLMRCGYKMKNILDFALLIQSAVSSGHRVVSQCNLRLMCGACNEVNQVE